MDGEVKCTDVNVPCPGTHLDQILHPSSPCLVSPNMLLPTTRVSTTTATLSLFKCLNRHGGTLVQVCCNWKLLFHWEMMFSEWDRLLSNHHTYSQCVSTTHCYHVYSGVCVFRSGGVLLLSCCERGHSRHLWTWVLTSQRVPTFKEVLLQRVWSYVYATCHHSVRSSPQGYRLSSSWWRPLCWWRGERRVVSWPKICLWWRRGVLRQRML